MQAFRIHALGVEGAWSLDRVRTPTPRGADEVLVRVRAAGVNPGDWKLQAGRMGLAPPLPYTMGLEFSGIVVRTGSHVRAWHAGDEVLGYVPVISGGAYAEYVVAQADSLARKPASLSFEQAAALPVAGLTAHKALLETAKLQAGQRVLIQGASGAVGTAAVRIAKRAGAHVIGTASGRNRDYVLGLGADEVIDYRTQRFEDLVRDIDVVLDGAGGDVAARSTLVMRKGGLLITLAGAPDKAACEAAQVRCSINVNFMPDDRAVFDDVVGMAARGELVIPVGETFALEKAADALAAVKAGGGHGRTVLVMSEAAAHGK